MMTVEQIRERLKDMNLSAVARSAGVSRASVYRFVADGSQPLYGTVKALSDYLEQR